MGSSQKGGRYEREVAKKLSLWLTQGESNGELIRSVSSGGWKFRKTRQAGDLGPNGPRGDEFRSIFGVECKNRQEFQYHHYWTSDNPKLFEWWDKHCKECDEAGIIPIIIWKRNYVPDLIGMWEDFFERITDYYPIPHIISFKSGDNWLSFSRLDDFIEVVNPDVFMSTGEEWLKIS